MGLIILTLLGLKYLPGWVKLVWLFQEGRKNYYFGSIPAIYSVLTAEDIGIKRRSLERVGLSKGGVVLNKKAIIRASELIRTKTNRKGK